MLKEPQKFFDHIRRSLAGGSLTESQVLGLNLFLQEADKRKLHKMDLSTIMGQSWWETGKTMAPVEEAYYLPKSQQMAYLRSKKYWPYYGRGHIQNTWEYNYKKLSVMWKDMTGEDADFVKNPGLLLENKYSVPITFEGFKRGIWTGKSIDDYIDDIDEPYREDLREYANARRIVNGTDRAATIAEISIQFEEALTQGGWTVEAAPVPAPVEDRLPKFLEKLKLLIEEFS